MGEKLTRLSSPLLFPYLYGLIFIAYKSSRYLPSFDVIAAVSAYVLYTLITYYLLVLFCRWSSTLLASLQTMVFWISILNILTIAQVCGYSYAYIPDRFYMAFYLFIFALLAGLCFIKKRIQAPAGIIRFANLFFLVLFAVFIISAITDNKGKKERDQNRNTHSFENFSITGKREPDIVWILMDEYGSSGFLQKETGFKNPLDSILKQDHFYVPDTIKTRFTSTLFSVYSIFDFDRTTTPSSYYSCTGLLRESKWAPLMEQEGYHFINLSSFDIAGENKIENRSGYPQTYIDQLFSGTLFTIVYSGIKYTQVKCDAYNQRIYHLLDSSLSAKNKQPQFIWAHLAIPHAPFSRNAKGDYLPEENFSETDTALIKQKYTGYILYGNKLILELLKKHPDLNEKIVIVSGDHGPRYPIFKTTVSGYPFAAIHLPGQYDTSRLKHVEYISQIPAFIIHHLSQ